METPQYLEKTACPKIPVAVIAKPMNTSAIISFIV